MQYKNFLLPCKQMNSKTSTESMLLRYEKISKKAVKLGSFVQCSVHVFLGHDGCV